MDIVSKIGFKFRDYFVHSSNEKANLDEYLPRTELYFIIVY